MKNILFIILICFNPMSVISQDYDKLNQNDSICKIIENDTSAIDYEFEVLVESEYYLPYLMKYEIKSSDSRITKITRKYSRIPNPNPYNHAYDCGEEVYLIDGKILSFVQYDFSLSINPDLVGTDDLIKKAEKMNPWELNVFFWNDELIHYYSNGHGMTERDDFDPEVHSREMSVILQDAVHKKFPLLK